MAELEQIIARHPRLYHMIEAGSWESIRQHGLLSTTALLDLFEVGEPRRTRIEANYRPENCDLYHPEHGHATIRRHSSRLSPGHLENVLLDNV